jgi:hypothetical protein
MINPYETIQLSGGLLERTCGSFCRRQPSNDFVNIFWLLNAIKINYYHAAQKPWIATKIP